MTRRFAKGAVALVVDASLLAGCTGARILDPPDGNTRNPVRQFSVQFHPNFVPGSFSAQLDGRDITPLFAPAPAPGGTSVAQWNDPFAPNYAFVNGFRVIDPHKLEVNSSVDPQSGFTLQDQRLTATFDPPQLHFRMAGPTSLPKNTTLAGDICMEPTPTGPFPLTVKLAQGPTASISINGAPQGVPVSVTLVPTPNPARTCVPISIGSGSDTGAWSVGATAVGFDADEITGSVF